VQLNRFLEVGKSFFLGLALTGDVEFQALGDIPLPLTPNGSRKWSLHDLTVSQARGFRAVAVIRFAVRRRRFLSRPPRTGLPGPLGLHLLGNGPSRQSRIFLRLKMRCRLSVSHRPTDNPKKANYWRSAPRWRASDSNRELARGLINSGKDPDGEPGTDGTFSATRNTSKTLCLSPSSRPARFFTTGQAA
jgi:hypothetical protein